MRNQDQDITWRKIAEFIEEPREFEEDHKDLLESLSPTQRSGVNNVISDAIYEYINQSEKKPENDSNPPQ